MRAEIDSEARSMHAETVPTIRELVAASKPWLEKRGVDGARTDAELLIAHALGMRRLDLFLDLDRPLSDDEVARCRALVARRGKREPVSHIVGQREFWSLAFTVTKDTLAPRPETEHLVELALERVPADAAGTFADVCTGTGCVAIALLKERPQLQAVATDISAAAVDVARANAERHGVLPRLTLRTGDLLLGVDGPLAFVVANPPYIRDDERGALPPEVRDHEPALALFGEGLDGLGHHRRILEQAAPLVDAGGFCALEIGAGQGDACRAIEVAGWRFDVVVKDLAKLDRVALWTRV